MHLSSLVYLVLPLVVSAAVCPAPDVLVYDTCTPPQSTPPPPIQHPQVQQPSAIPELLTFSEWRARHEPSRRVHLLPSLVSYPPIEPYPSTEQQIDLTSLSPKTHALVPQQSSFIHPLPDAGSSLPSDPLVPLKSRTNYASLDCSASVQYSSPQARGATSILSPSKDRYMLTPCTSEQTFIIVELCDEIEIDTIVLANYEFFSSMFKHFRLRAAQTYVLGVDEDVPWTDLGTFRAGNIRGLQVFHTKPASGFFRYLRIDFVSHYGSEHFCPISLLKVYGLNQLDAWRRDQARERFEADIIARVEKYYDADGVKSVFEEKATVSDEPNETTAESPSISVPPSTSTPHTENTVFTAEPVATPLTTSNVTSEQADITVSSPDYSSPTPVSVSNSNSNSNSNASYSSTSPSSSPTTASASAPTATVDTPTNSSSASAVTTPNVMDVCVLPSGLIFNQIMLMPSVTCNISDQAQPSISSTALPDSSASQNISISSISSSSSESTEEASSPRIISENSQGGRVDNNARGSLNGGPILSSTTINPSESIYGAIMKKISALEQNATLSIRFMEEQSALLREAFVRMETRLGDLESQKIKQDQMVRRMILDLDFHRAKVEQDRIALESQVNMLSGEILFTRKLGAAQLISLCGLIVFVGLTRTSPSTPFMSYALPSPVEREYRARRDEKLRRSHDVFESNGKRSHDRREKDRPVPSTLMLRALSASKRTPNRSVSRRPGTPSSLSGPSTSPIISTSGGGSANPFVNEKRSGSSSRREGSRQKQPVSGRRRSLTPPPQPTWMTTKDQAAVATTENNKKTQPTEAHINLVHQTPQTPTPSTNNHTHTNNSSTHSYKFRSPPSSPTIYQSTSSSSSSHQSPSNLRNPLTVDTSQASSLPLSPESLSPSSRNGDSIFV